MYLSRLLEIEREIDSIDKKSLLSIEEFLIESRIELQREIEWVLLTTDWQSLEFKIQDEEDFYYLDARLRYFDNDWEILTGDSSFDTDHRGYWGYCSICKNSIPSEIVDDLIYSLLSDLYV